MDQPQPPPKRKPLEIVFAALMVLLSGMYIVRGALAIRTGVYEGTARYSGPYRLVGRAAELTGWSTVLLGLMLLFALAAMALARKRIAFVLAGLAAIGSIAAYVASQE